DGYLNAGVCNDSNAVVEIGTEKALYGEAFLSVYPLVRPAALNVAPEYNKLDDILPSLPNDAERNHATPVEDTLCRILAMSPHGVGSDRFPDARLAAQMMEVRGRVDERCHLFEGKPLPPPRVHRTASGVPVEIPTGALPRRGRRLGPGFAVPSDKSPGWRAFSTGDSSDRRRATRRRYRRGD